MRVNYRYAEAKDLPKIVGTYNGTIASRMVTADLDPVSVESKREWFEAHNKTDRPLWVVELEGEYAGWISFNSFYGRPAYSGTVEVSIYLEEKVRGKGLGKECLQMAIVEAKRLGIHTLLGFVFGHNVVSLQLFRQYNFVDWAQLPGVAIMDGIERDLVILGLKV